MEILTLSAILLAVLFGLLALGVWIGLALGIVAFIALSLNVNSSPGDILTTSVWGISKSWDLIALPMFIWMGEILYRTRLTEAMFEGLAPMTRRLSGRLLHVNIMGSALFAAVSGSSAATCATIGRITLPELHRRGYSESMTIGTLAGAGTLGLLIPPSIMMIVYAAATDQSIARLFIAGVVPGLMLGAMFMLYISVWAAFNRHQMPPVDAGAPPASMRALGKLAPVSLLIVAVIGSIYGGLASATEASVVGVIGALALSWSYGTLSRDGFRDALLSGTRTSCMIILILSGAAYLTLAMGFTGIPRSLAEVITAYQLSPWLLLAVLSGFYLVLGCFLEGISMIVLTTAVIIPVVQAAGFDLVWFGIYLVLLVEIAQITPPLGFNLFVLQAMTGKNIFSIAKYSLPVFVIMLVAVVLIAVFPQIVLWLPSTMLDVR